MKLSPVAKAVVGAALLLGALAFALLVEFAVNAGRVHHGVSVRGYDIGGLNPPEAQDALERYGDRLKEAPLIFMGLGFDCRFTPAHVGWGPQEFDTMEAAMAVGRSGPPAEALAQRWRALTDGVDISWAGRPNPERMKVELDRCEETAEGMGVTIDRPRLRYRIKQMIVTWPRGPVPIPVKKGD